MLINFLGIVYLFSWDRFLWLVFDLYLIFEILNIILLGLVKFFDLVLERYVVLLS